MASADHVDLVRLLLRAIDRHPPGAVDGVDLATADRALVERLLSDQILTPEPPLQHISPGPTSQDELPRPVRSEGGEAVAFSVEGGPEPERVDPRELVHYPINLLRLCEAVRNDNQLTGSKPEALSPRTVLIGWKVDRAGRRPVVLCRLLRDGNAYETVHMLTSRLGTGRLILLTPTERMLGIDVLNSLRDRGAEIIPAETALQRSGTSPFALRMDEWHQPVSSAPDTDIALLVDTRRHRAFFLGHELALRAREFKVLVELAKAFGSGGYVSRDQLYHVMYPEARHGDAKVYEEQVMDAVSRIRAAVRKAATAAGRTIDSIIENKRKVGYRLSPETGPVDVR